MVWLVGQTWTGSKARIPAALGLIALVEVLSGILGLGIAASRVLAGSRGSFGSDIAGWFVSPVVIWAGYLLFRGKREGLRLSVGLQAAQVFHFGIGPLMYQFVVGPALVTAFEHSTVFFSPVVDQVMWLGLKPSYVPAFVRINLLALVLYLFLQRRKWIELLERGKKRNS